MLADFIIEFTLLDPDPKAEYLMVYVDGLSITGLGGVGVIIFSLEKDNFKNGVQL